MERLEARLDRLEDTHRTVIAAAYENLSGTNQIHRCVLRSCSRRSTCPRCSTCWRARWRAIVRVDRIRLVMEGTDEDVPPHGVVMPVRAGFVRDYVTLGHDVRLRQVTLRQCAGAAREMFGEDGDRLRSEAILHLDLGAGRPPALLVFAAEDAQQFGATQGTELLAFFTAAFERVLVRHLR